MRKKPNKIPYFGIVRVSPQRWIVTRNHQWSGGPEIDCGWCNAWTGTGEAVSKPLAWKEVNKLLKKLVKEALPPK